jgi:phosphomannomutase
MKPVQTLKISISGVRGVVGDSLTPDLLVRFAQSFGTYVGPQTVVIGRDTRTSGEMVKHAVLGGLISSGCKVVDLDIVPVPTVQFMVRNLRAAGGIAITASHNPAQWNALKFIRGDGCFLNHYQARELIDIYHQGEYRTVPGRQMCEPRRNARAVSLHATAIIEKIGKLPARGKKLLAVVDSVNGAGSVMAAPFLESLGCKVVTINSKPDGIFPRPPEPLPQNLTDLCHAVRRHNADIGFAQDADADRLAVVSEKGLPIGEDFTLALAVDFVLSREKGTVVVNLATSHVIDDIVKRRKCRLLKSKIGEINVTELMMQENAVIGGEGNGGVIYPAVNMGRDSFTGMALIMHLLAQSARPVSQIVARLPRYSMHKAAVPCPQELVVEVMDRLAREVSGKNVDRTDGLKIQTPKGWILMRASNTEPILRVVAEAGDPEAAAALNAGFREKVESLIRSAAAR